MAATPKMFRNLVLPTTLTLFVTKLSFSSQVMSSYSWAFTPSDLGLFGQSQQQMRIVWAYPTSMA